jgi:5'-deoxynucleotidase YfbR-like HD superfamily hydrolase
MISTQETNTGTLVPSTDRGNWICTYTCKRFHVLDPSEDEVCLEDIAQSLSHMCRFAGHVNEFYSVAQHCVLGSYEVPKGLELTFLMHDSSEGYAVDIPRPLKYAPGMEAYLDIEDRIYRVIAGKYGLPLELPPDIKVVDNRMLLTEQRDLRDSTEVLDMMRERTGLEPFDWHISSWSPYVAKQNFLQRFKQLHSGNSD